MGSNRQQWAALGAILVVLLLVLQWQRGQAVPVPASTVSVAVPAPVPAGPRSSAVKRVPGVRIDRLGGEAIEPVDTGRDPFRFGESRRADAGSNRGGPTGRPDEISSTVSPAGQAAGAEPLLPAGPPAPPPITLKLIGLIQSSRAGVRVAVLSDGRGVYYGAEGAVIEGRFRVVRVAADSVDVAYLDGRGLKRLPLSGT